MFKKLLIFTLIALAQKVFSAECYDEELCDGMVCGQKTIMNEYFNNLGKCGAGSCIAVDEMDLNGHICWVKGDNYKNAWPNISKECVRHGKKYKMFAQGYWDDGSTRVCYDFKKTGNCIFDGFKECNV